MMSMMDGSCGPFMAVIMGLAGLLGLGLAGSLIVLVSVLIGHLRKPPASI